MNGKNDLIGTESRPIYIPATASTYLPAKRVSHYGKWNIAVIAKKPFSDNVLSHIYNVIIKALMLRFVHGRG